MVVQIVAVRSQPVRHTPYAEGILRSSTRRRAYGVLAYGIDFGRIGGMAYGVPERVTDE